MKVEPKLNQTALLAQVNRVYGFRLERLEFIPVGMVWAYRAVTKEREYFL